MIDTIVLRIKGTRKYDNLIRNMDISGKNGTTQESFTVKKSEIKNARKNSATLGIEMIDALKMNYSGEYLLRSKRAKHAIASSHYELSYVVNYTQDFLEFNFSIPKFLHGSNIVMFVDHLGDKNYNFHECVEIEHNMARSFDLFQKFIIMFFRTEFPGSEVDMRDVEIERIDVCFNQVFRSKQDALKYLEYQKRQKKKYSREEEEGVKEWATSFMYVTKRYSSKIYHKGAEYTKHDRKEHEKYNKKVKKQHFRVEEYQEFADKILRYEITIRHTMLNYLHKSELFRGHCPFYQKALETYKKFDSAIQKNKRIEKKVGSLLPELREQFIKDHPYTKVDSGSRKLHKYVSKLITKRTFFNLQIDEEARLYNKMTVDYDCRDALFSKGLLMLCMRKLMEFMNEFQIKELPPETQVADAIDKYNQRTRKGKFIKSDMMAFYRNLIRVGSFQAVAKYEYVSRATIYRYKEKFRRIGITDQHLLPKTESGIPVVALDLRNYHSEHMFNIRFTNKRNLMDLF